MGRRSSYISHISEKDYEAFRILWNCQHIPKELMPISNNRIESYRKQGIIDICKNKNNETIIRCTDKGYKYISKLDDFRDRKPYKSTTAAEHNCKLAQIYSQLTKEEQLAWRTEKELKDMYNERLEELRDRDAGRWEQLRNITVSASDGGVVINSEIQMLYEVVTGTYGQAELEAHEAFVQAMEATATYEHT